MKGAVVRLFVRKDPDREASRVRDFVKDLETVAVAADVRCRDCKFFRMVSSEIAPSRVGTCRRVPPTHDGWPTVPDDGWCGRLEPATK